MKQLLLIFTAVIFISSCADFTTMLEEVGSEWEEAASDCFGGCLTPESWWSCYPASNKDTKKGTGFVEVVSEHYICKVHYLETKKELGIYEGQVKARTDSRGEPIPYGGLSVVRERTVHKYFDPHGNGYFKRLDTDENYYIEGYFENGFFIRGKFINESSTEKVQFEGSYKQPITTYDNPSLHAYSWIDKPVYDTGTYTRESLTEGKLTKYFHAGITYASLEDYKNKQAAEKAEGVAIWERAFAERKRLAERKVVAAENKRKQAALAAEKRKQKLLTQLIERCTEYGFTGENNIATCVQNEAFNDRRLAQQRYEFQTQLAQQAKIAQETQAALEAQLAMNKASEEVTFLQMVLEGIANIDWATQVQLANQQKQINALARKTRQLQQPR